LLILPAIAALLKSTGHNSIDLLAFLAGPFGGPAIITLIPRLC
jgi:hypothetical protein